KARRCGADHAQVAARLHRRIRLRVPGLLLWRSTEQEQHDDAFRLFACACGFARCEQVREREAESTERADGKRFPARKAVTKAGRFGGEQGEHGECSCLGGARASIGGGGRWDGSSMTQERFGVKWKPGTPFAHSRKESPFTCSR